MDVLVYRSPVARVLHLEPPHPNVRRHSLPIESNYRASHRIIIWGHHPLVMKSLLVVGLLHFVLSLVGE